MYNQVDSLSEFDGHQQRTGRTFIAVCFLYSLLMASAVVYLIWLFNKPVAQLFADTEFTVLFVIHVIYPAIALYLFIRMRKSGWVLMLFSSAMNVCYACFAYAGGSEPNITTGCFITHAILMVLFCQKQLMVHFNMSRKFFTVALSFSIVAAILFTAVLVFG